MFILLQEFKCIYCESFMPKVESASAVMVAFMELHERDHDLAADIHDAATRYLTSKEPSVFANLS